MHIFELPRAVFEGLAATIVEGEERPDERFAAATTEEGLDLVWTRHRSDAQREPAEASVRFVEETGPIFSFTVLLTPLWNDDYTRLVDIEQGVAFDTHYWCESLEQLAAYAELMDRFKQILTGVVTEHSISLATCRQLTLGIPIVSPEGAFMIEES